jgi:hypothetical protein
MTMNQRQAKKWSSRIRELQKPRAGKKRQMTNKKAKKNSTPLTLSMKALTL